MPSELSAEDLADTVEEAEDQLQEEASRSRRPARTFEDLSQAPLRSSALSDQDVAALKEGFRFWQTSRMISSDTPQGGI